MLILPAVGHFPSRRLAPTRPAPDSESVHDRDPRLTFQAETQKLLDLMIHSLYSNKEVFLRELISNASDALDRRRFEAVSNPELAAEGELGIELVANRIARVLTISDNGIGMNREDLVEHLGTIARSGTLEFLKQAGEGDDASPDLIGQFGVGFYASFMVADEVDVVSRRAGEDKARAGPRRAPASTRSTTPRATRRARRSGSRSRTSTARPASRTSADEWVLRNVVKKYSDFVAYPIKLTVIEEAPAPEAATATTRSTSRRASRPSARSTSRSTR